ncbi:hypothetical protein [Streptomyces sp. S.PNR 29]|uniref:hypothetical protein n=1 Tax=Streptomyces sp. S.PNR 29 TaxID=2973805 RepID=UPI0025B1D7FA|nr:hypothetical protein [Streptomyces sp. S.PNR 29]MDN0199465.1 hypothetical protein [Streptomyces sp. S.PNR 29]
MNGSRPPSHAGRADRPPGAADGIRPAAVRQGRRRARLRVLVLLLALLVPSAHADARAEPVAAVSGESGGTAIEYDLLDNALRPPARAAHRPVVPLRPAPLPDAEPPAASGHPPPTPPRPPHPLRCLRSVVLRC